MSDPIKREDAIAWAIKLASSKWKESYIRKVFGDIPSAEVNESEKPTSCEDAISRADALLRCEDERNR